MTNDGNLIGNAIAGVVHRQSGNIAKAEKCENLMTEFVNVMIAETKAKRIRERNND